MLVQLCVGNYSTHDGLINGLNGIFQASSKLHNSQEVIWILFNNPKSGQLIKNKKCTLLWTQNTDPTWTPIKPIYIDIQIDSNSTHIITKMKFPIQLIVAHTIHRTQGLTFDHLAFDLNRVYKHGLTYTSLSCTKTNKISTSFNLYKWFFFKSTQVLP